MAGAGLPKTGLGATALFVKLLRHVLLGCSQERLAKRSGVCADLISRYESGNVKQPTARNIDRLLSAAGVLDLKQPLLQTAEHLSRLLGPPPAAGPARLGDLLQRASQRPLQTDSRLLAGEYSAPNRRNFSSNALLTRFLRTVLIGCSRAQLSRRTGIHPDVLYRIETGRVQKASPAHLDRLLAEARVLHLKEPLLRAMSSLSILLTRRGQAANDPAPPPLTPAQTESFQAFAENLLRRTLVRLGVEAPSSILPRCAGEDATSR